MSIIVTCLNSDLRMDQHRHLDGSYYYSPVGEDQSLSPTRLWDLDSASLIVPLCFRNQELILHQAPADGMKRELSRESGYQTATDETNSSSQWALDWPTAVEDQHPQQQQHHLGWTCSSSDVQQPLEDLSYWFQQPEPSTCQSHQLEQENWSTTWGTPDDWTTEPQIIQNTIGMATPPSSGAGAATGRSESSSSDETETVSLPSGKLVYLN